MIWPTPLHPEVSYEFCQVNNFSYLKHEFWLLNAWTSLLTARNDYTKFGVRDSEVQGWREHGWRHATRYSRGYPKPQRLHNPGAIQSPRDLVHWLVHVHKGWSTVHVAWKWVGGYASPASLITCPWQTGGNYCYIHHGALLENWRRENYTRRGKRNNEKRCHCWVLPLSFTPSGEHGWLGWWPIINKPSWLIFRYGVGIRDHSFVNLVLPKIKGIHQIALVPRYNFAIPVGAVECWSYEKSIWIWSISSSARWGEDYFSSHQKYSLNSPGRYSVSRTHVKKHVFPMS